MGRLLFSLLFFSVTSFALPFSLVRVGTDAVDITYRLLEARGVMRLDPYDPRLPYPQVQAMEALYQPRTGAFAYVNGGVGAWGGVIAFKNRFGGNVHLISAGPDFIQFTTPYSGNVAHANRFKTIAGWDYHFYCRSQPVVKAAWDHCIRQFFIEPLVNQF